VTDAELADMASAIERHPEIGHDALALYAEGVGPRDLSRASERALLAEEVAESTYARAADDKFAEAEQLAEEVEAARSEDEARSLAGQGLKALSESDHAEAALGAQGEMKSHDPGRQERHQAALEVANAAFGEYPQREHPTIETTAAD
jgi:hypothetical protein